MKLMQQVSKRASVTLLITFFIVSVAQAQQNQARGKTGVEVRGEPAPPVMHFPRPVFLKGNALQASAIVRFLPDYPPDVKPDQLSGIVIVSVVINKEGIVRQVQYLIGHPALRKAVGEALRSWRWEPTLVKGVAQEVEGRVRFDFDTNGTVSINTSDDPEVVDLRPIYRAIRLKKVEADLAELRAAPSPALYAKVAHGYAEADRIQEAIEICKEGISRYPDEIILYMGMARLYLDPGKIETQSEQTKEELLKVLERGAQIKVGPDSPAQTRHLFSALLFNLGFVYIVKQQYVEAKEVLARALSLNPPEEIKRAIYETLGPTYVELADKDSAIAMAQKIAELGDREKALQLLGELHTKLWKSGDKKSAAEVMRIVDKVCRMPVPKPKR